MSAVVLRERPTRAQWLFSLLSIAGIIAITLSEKSEGEIMPIGVLGLFGAVAAGSACTVVSRKTSDDFSVFERTFVMQAMGAIFFTVLFRTNKKRPSHLLSGAMSAEKDPMISHRV